MAAQDVTSMTAFGSALAGHARCAALRARHALGQGLNPANLHRFLTDPHCLRYPTELVFSREGLDAHQFAEPFYAKSDKEQQCRLHVDPRLQENLEALCLVTAYMAAAINYGQAATAEIALLQGSIVSGLSSAEFYAKICRLADFLGLQPVSLDVQDKTVAGDAA